MIRQVPEQSIFLFTCNHIIAPTITELGIFNKKKVSYDGYKALAYLHPNVFSSDTSIIDKRYRTNKVFFIRCTGFGATHDIGRNGINDQVLEKIIDLLKDKGEIIISSERELPEIYNRYLYSGKKNDIFHYMAFSELFIGDSVSMCAEAALLGTPVVEYDDYWFEMEQLLELECKYRLINLFKPPNLNPMLAKINDIVNTPGYKEIVSNRKNKFIEEKINVSNFLTWFMENYPESFLKYKKSPYIQYKFKNIL